MSLFSSLRRDQKEAIVLLQTGTFLEYFDLMLYVHMAVLLNELFFPKTDPHTAALLTAFTFCTTYVFRPFGALLFGYIGDNVGRKTTVILTTMMMAISCIIMANLPTYAQIGIAAAWFVTLCRIVQGISSMGEIIGAEIYLTEITKPPVSYVATSLVDTCTVLGTMFSLFIATFCTTSVLNWRMAFWIGAVIAVVGTAARTRLRETPDFVDMKRRMKRVIEEAEESGLGKAANLLKKTSSYWKEKVNKKTALAYFLVQNAWPVCFYFSYIHCGNILKSMGYTVEQIIHQNFLVSIFQLANFLIFAFLSYRVYPLTLVKFRLLVFVPCMLATPFLLTVLKTPEDIFFIQAFSIFFALASEPATAILLKHFPVFRRFTYASFLYAASRAVMYIVTSFGLVYLTESLGHCGMLVIIIPTTFGFYWGIRHFEKIEQFNESTSLRKPFILDRDEDPKVTAVNVR